MVQSLRVLLRLMVLALLLGALGFISDPSTMEALFAVTVLGTHGLGTLRGDLGGTFLMLALVTFYGAHEGHTAWLAAPNNND
jgi:hypothetical protein